MNRDFRPIFARGLFHDGERSQLHRSAFCIHIDLVMRVPERPWNQISNPDHSSFAGQILDSSIDDRPRTQSFIEQFSEFSSGLLDLLHRFSKLWRQFIPGSSGTEHPLLHQVEHPLPFDQIDQVRSLILVV